MQDDFTEIMNNLTENARFALQKSDYYAKRYNNGYMSTEHLLLGILSQDTSTGARFLADEDVNLESVEKTINHTAVEVPGSQMAMMSLSEAAVLTLRMAANFTKEQGIKLIGTEHILYALLRQPNSRASLILQGLKVDLNSLTNTIEEYTEKQAEDAKIDQKKAGFTRKAPLKWLTKYGQDLTEMAKQGKLDTVIGRDQEIERTITVLCRRTKSNPVLIGEAGVGKTAIVEGLATRIAKNEVPGSLIGKKIYQIDLSSVVAGTKFRGEFEERIKGIIDEAAGNKDLILFIDEIHLLSGAGSGEGSLDAANILKPALARGQIRLIGASTMDEYRKTIEKDKALSRRFQTVIVEEPSDTVVLRILKGIKSHYEKHHGVVIPDEILETAVNMSKRYINDRFMPDKVIDVIDEASAIAKVAADKKGGGEYKKLKIEREDLQKKIEETAEAEDFEKAALYKTRVAKIDEEIEKLEKAGLSDDIAPVLTEENLATAISLKTGIPVSKVHGSEMKMLTDLEKHLDKAIIGQDDAIKAVAKAIRRGRSGIGDPKRPIGSFLFLGPTGVGKTELAKTLAEAMFGDQDALVRIDMSEYMEKHAVSRLVGSPPGYVGFDEGGQLTEKIRNKPYSVILFDEIEKAHPDVFNILLQVLDDGHLTDSKGRKVDFRNTILIMTSNLGATALRDEKAVGFGAKTVQHDHTAMEKRIREELKNAFRPELLNRIDEIIVFHKLTKPELRQIVQLMTKDIKTRLAELNIELKFTSGVIDLIAEEGFDPEYGARPIRRAIQKKIEDPLSEALLSGEIRFGQKVTIGSQKGKVTIKETKVAPKKEAVKASDNLEI